MLSIKGRVFCPDPQSMEDVIKRLRSDLKLAGSSCDLSDIEQWRLPATILGDTHVPSTDIWTFKVYVDTMAFWNILDGTLEQLYIDGAVHSYVIEPHCPKSILIQN